MPANERQALAKQHAQVGADRVAYVDEGDGPPVMLLHGCPFSSFVWRQVIAKLSPRFRCLAPDLLGLGDTETPDGADWRLPTQLEAVVGLLDELGLQRVAVVGHDQGGAIAQLLAAGHPGRVTALVLADAEAYDNWPSADELPFVRATQLPVLGRLVLWAWSRRRWRGWLGHHITGMDVSYIALLTAFYVDNGPRYPCGNCCRRSASGSCPPPSGCRCCSAPCGCISLLRALYVCRANDTSGVRFVAFVERRARQTYKLRGKHQPGTDGQGPNAVRRAIVSS